MHDQVRWGIRISGRIKFSLELLTSDELQFPRMSLLKLGVMAEESRGALGWHLI